jgi:dCTP deaminase
MFLSDKDILQRIKAGEINIKPFVRVQLQPASYDLRLHTNFRIFKSTSVSHIDVKETFDVTELVKVKRGGEFIIHPGEFVLASTFEKIKMPNDLLGTLEGRSSLGRLGLIVHATASHIPPGFLGHLTFEVSNLSNLPIKLYAGMRVAQLSFSQLSSSVTKPYGKKGLRSKYQHQEPPTASRIWEDFSK